MNEREIRRTNLKTLISHYGLLIVLLLTTLFIATSGYFFAMNNERESLIIQQQSSAQEEVSLIDYVLRTSISNTFQDMEVIRDSNEFDEYMNDPTAFTLDETQQMLVRIASNKVEFLSIRFINTDGDEIIHVANQNGVQSIFEDDELENKSDSYFFQDTINMLPDQLYISFLDLYTRDGEIVTPYQPIIRFIVPLFDSNNTRMGILVVNYDAYHILSVFSAYLGQDHSNSDLGLYSNNTLYRLSYDTSLEEYILEISSCEECNEEAVQLTSIHIDETLAVHLISSEDFLQIYSYPHIDEMIAEHGSFLLRYPIVIYLVDFIIILAFVVFGAVLKTRSDDKVLLNANKYLSNTNKDAVLMTDFKRDVTYVNKTFEEIFGYTLPEIKGKSPRDLIGIHEVPRFIPTSDNEYVFDDLIWNKNKNGVYILSKLTLKSVSTFTGSIRHFIGIYSDPPSSVTSTYETVIDDNGNLKYGGQMDVLADVFQEQPKFIGSTTLFIVRTRDFLNFASDHVSTYPFDIQMKLAEYLVDQIGSKFFVASPRKGYLFLLCDLDPDEETIESMIDIISRVINQFTLDNSIHRSMKYLISVDQINSPLDTFMSLIHNAFVAMETLKKSENLKYLVHKPPMTADLLRDDEISQQLENGFLNDEFFMNYQVQMSLSNGNVVGVEALLRWKNELLGNIPPNEFIPKIEKTYYIRSLSSMVVEKVIKDLSPYVERFPENFRISVNMTSYDFFNKPVMEEIVELIESSPISTRHFCFEITESNYLENTIQTNEIIEFLHRKGIIVALDDFGKGFSALGSLKHIHVDKVKIDRVFIKDYPQDDDGLVFHMIAELVTNLGLTIIVEGTENIDQVNLAKRYGCQEHQGYLVSRPLPIKEFISKFIFKK